MNLRADSMETEVAHSGSILIVPRFLRVDHLITLQPNMLVLREKELVLYV